MDGFLRPWLLLGAAAAILATPARGDHILRLHDFEGPPEGLVFWSSPGPQSLGYLLGGPISLFGADVGGFGVFRPRSILIQMSFDIVVPGFPAAEAGLLEVVHTDYDPAQPGAVRVPRTIYSATVGVTSTLEHHRVVFEQQDGSSFGTATDLLLDWSVSDLVGTSWGLDNVLFQVVPEPSTALLCGGAAVAAGFARRQRRRARGRTS